MKHFLISVAAALAAIALFPSCASGQTPEKEGYLWEISGNGLAEPSWLFGTFHGTADIRYNYVDSIPGYHAAFDRARLVCGEVDMKNRGDAGDAAATKKLFEPLPADSTYRELLSAEDYRYLDSTVVARSKELGGNPEPLMSLRPAALSFTISQMSQLIELKNKGMTPGQFQVMDGQILKVAEERSKATTGFETASEQLAMLIVSSGSLRQDAESLIRGLKSDGITKHTAGVIARAYRSGELKEMERYGVMLDSLVGTILPAKDMEQYYSQTDKLIRGRNEAWMEKIPGMIAAQSTFIAVGARHLPGDLGLISMLREKGYTVRAVNR